MRIVEPQKVAHQHNTPQKKLPKKTTLIIILLLAMVVGYMYFNSAVTEAPSNQEQSVEAENIQPASSQNDELVLERTGELRVFSGNEFRLFYDNLLQQDLDPIGVPPVISGNDIADARIRQIAEQRGYKLRANPSISLPSVQGFQLHKSAHEPWRELQAAAKEAGHDISIVSAYRSVENQRQLFTTRLRAEGVDIDDVAAGSADQEVDTVLVTSSIPGYSKHHTGYTIDLLCAGFAFDNFENSTCNDWMIANNYEQPKKHGFIPSYPVDADLQGPDPEAWEYVYVGADLLRQ